MCVHSGIYSILEFMTRFVCKPVWACSNVVEDKIPGLSDFVQVSNNLGHAIGALFSNR